MFNIVFITDNILKAYYYVKKIKDKINKLKVLLD